MRDESIQTAEASITATGKHLQHTTISAWRQTGYDAVTQRNLTLHTDISSFNGMIAGKTETTPKRLHPGLIHTL